MRNVVEILKFPVDLERKLRDDESKGKFLDETGFELGEPSPRQAALGINPINSYSMDSCTHFIAVRAESGVLSANYSRAFARSGQNIDYEYGFLTAIRDEIAPGTIQVIYPNEPFPIPFHNTGNMSIMDPVFSAEYLNNYYRIFITQHFPISELTYHAKLIAQADKIIHAHLN